MLKSFPKIITVLFLIIFIFQLVCLIFLFTIPQVSRAADSAAFKPQVSIGTDIVAGTSYTPDGSTSMIAKYIRAIYKYAIGIVGILAAVVLMIGGVMWIVAGGNATAIGEAKSWIGASLTGLVLALSSYLILATINPALVDLKTTGIKTVEPVINQSTLQIGSPCTINIAPYCVEGLECKNGKCAITDLTTQQCQASNYSWNESTNCNGATYSDLLCSCKGSKPNNYKCCTPKSTTVATPVSGGCCHVKKQTELVYRCDYSSTLTESGCMSGGPFSLGVPIGNTATLQFFPGNYHCENVNSVSFPGMIDVMCKPN